jgi:hypothetical protein
MMGARSGVVITVPDPITNSGAGVCVCGAAPPSRPQGDEMNVPITYDESLELIRDLSDEHVLLLNRAVLQVMFERNIAAGALDEALDRMDAEGESWENSFRTG